MVELVKVVYEKGFQHPFNPFCIILKKLGSRMVVHHWADSTNLYTELQNVEEAATPLHMRFRLPQLTYVDRV